VACLADFNSPVVVSLTQIVLLVAVYPRKIPVVVKVVSILIVVLVAV